MAWPEDEGPRCQARTTVSGVAYECVRGSMHMDQEGHRWRTVTTDPDLSAVLTRFGYRSIDVGVFHPMPFDLAPLPHHNDQEAPLGVF